MKFSEKTNIFWLAFFLATAITYFFGLDLPLLGPDEPRYAQVAREMYERNDFITPTLGGFEWFEKPALLYWLQILSYSIYGVSEFAARFGSAVFGLLIVLSLWFFGKITSKNSEFANWLALISATSIGLLVFARAASFDIILTFPITASLVCFFAAASSLENQAPESSKSIKFLLGFYFFAGVALLAKGLVGIIFPLLIPALFYLLRRKIPPRIILISLLPGIIITFLVASLWYFPMYERHGWKFIDEFIIQHHFQRYTSNKYLHPQPFWFFWLVLPLMTLPWTPFFLLSIWNFLKDFKSTPESSSKPLDYQAELFAFCWLIVPLIFFSFSGSKLPGYILPSLPAASILTANYLYDLSKKHQKARKVLFAVAWAMLLSIVITLIILSNFIGRETLKPLISQASQKGYTSNKILTLHTISHNLEFYAAGRLVRTSEGKQRYFYGVAEIEEYMRLNNEKTTLVFVPLSYEKELAETNLLKTEKLADNGELALFVVSLKH